MKIVIIDDDGNKTTIENVLFYDCFTKEDVIQSVGEEKIDTICENIVSKCSDLGYYPSSEEFFDIIQESKCNC